MEEVRGCGMWGEKSAMSIGERMTHPLNIPGKRVRMTKWIHGRLCVARVKVEAIVPDADPSESCLEPATVKWLDEVQRLADTGDVEALEKHGEVFVRRSA